MRLKMLLDSGSVLLLRLFNIIRIFTRLQKKKNCAQQKIGDGILAVEICVEYVLKTTQRKKLNVSQIETA